MGRATFEMTRPRRRELLGDSLPNARCYLAALIRMNWRSTRVPAGDAQVQR